LIGQADFIKLLNLKEFIVAQFCIEVAEWLAPSAFRAHMQESPTNLSTGSVDCREPPRGPVN
jgi:hypothetical protein